MTWVADVPSGGDSRATKSIHTGWARAAHSVLPQVVVLCLLALIYYPLVVGRVLAGGDLQLYFHPYWEAVVRSLRAHQFPLWSADLFMGAPLMANSQLGCWYPLHWLLWLADAGGLIDTPRALHLCVLLHVALAALTMAALATARGWSPWEAALAGLSYAGSGFLAVHLEHLNQLEALAWFPLILMPPTFVRFGRRRWPTPSLLSVVALAMILLAGHMQMAFIVSLCVFVLALFEMGSYVAAWTSANIVQRVSLTLAFLLVRLGPFLLAGGLAGVQMVPTLTLVTLSGRSGGLNWPQAVSFSVAPWDLWRALLPPYLVPPLLPEGVGYLGLLAGGLALQGGWWAIRTHHRSITRWVWLAGVGLFLALGGYNPLYLLVVRSGVPGFVHFRAPARFMGLFVLASSLLAGKGLGIVLDRLRLSPKVVWRGIASAAIVLLVGLEMTWSGRGLPYAKATLPRAYTDMRPAVAQLQAAIENARRSEVVPGRFLSVSRTLFELGDRGELEAAYSGSLDSGALYAYLVAAKHREVLTPNLPLIWGIPSVDGYDGGLLPTRYYHLFSTLLVPGGTTDGRLRESLTEIPEIRWLDLMAVQFLMTDRTADAWVDGLLYDRQFRPRLDYGESVAVGWLPTDFRADALALLHYGGAGEVRVELENGRELWYRLPPSDTGDRTTWLRWDGVARVVGMEVCCVDPNGALQLVGASLVDGRLGAFYPLVLSPSYRLVHAGDIKLYERLSPVKQAVFVTSCEVAIDDSEALKLMTEPSFDPYRRVVLAPTSDEWATWCRSLPGAVKSTVGSVTVLSVTDTEMVFEVSTDSPGVVVISSAWDPAWRAQIETLDVQSGQTLLTDQILRADILFSAVPVAVGRWRIRMVYDPPWLAIGPGLSLLGIALSVVYGLMTGKTSRRQFNQTVMELWS